VPIVEFVKLDKPEKAKHLCQLASEFYHQGKRVLIIVVDDNQALTLDRFMWTWDRHSFLPHVWDNGSAEFMCQFEHVIDFAETYDDALRDAARKRYAQWQGVGCELRMR
jgi:DNA polymerase-3 subunit chi